MEETVSNTMSLRTKGKGRKGLFASDSACFEPTASVTTPSVPPPFSQEKRKTRLFPTRKLAQLNPYVQALQSSPYKGRAFTEEQGLHFKGRWRKEVFHVPPHTPLDLEVGVGNGHHFAFYGRKEPRRTLVGIDLKYKPLVQSIRRALQLGCTNACVVRFHALDLQELFAEKELNHLFIYFPDPWVEPRKPKKRILSKAFLEQTAQLQKTNSLIAFKTDSEEYFYWARENLLQNKDYKITKCLLSLHQSEEAKNNFITTFEALFLKQNKPIFYLEAKR